MVKAINVYRQSKGLQPVLLSDEISRACERHSSDMAKYRFVDHFSTGGSDWFGKGASPWDRMAASGYSYDTRMGENVAAGFPDAAGVMTGWKNSPDHDAVMSAPYFTVVGVSRVYAEDSPYGYYWTADFGGFIDPTAHPAGE